jgi:hypothetical protein
LPNGRYLRWYGAGEGLRWWSFDGEAFRMQTGLGEPYTVEGERREQVARTCAYMHSRGYWFPERFPAAMADLGQRREGGATFHVLRIKPKGALPLECWVDADLWLVSRVTWAMHLGTWCYTFSDHRTVAGLQLPFLIRNGWLGQPGHTKIQARDYQLRPEFPPESYTRWGPTPATAAASGEGAGTEETGNGANAEGKTQDSLTL